MSGRVSDPWPSEGRRLCFGGRGRLARAVLCGAGAPLARYRFKGEEKLQFEVNGQDYFLNFAEDEAYWYVLAPTLTGVQRIPVYVDSPAYERFGILGKNSHNIQN